MKPISREFLYDYLKQHRYNVLDFDMYRIFKMYSELEIQSDKDVLEAVDDFIEFWVQNAKEVNCDGLEERKEFLSCVKQELESLRQSIKISRTIEHKQYADIVDILAPSGRKTKILEVGAGQYPFPSILLAEKEFDIVAMDKNFYVSQKSLASMGVKQNLAYFDENGDVSKYDFVVGRFPCSAIEHMVRKCSQENKAYFIQLCDCYAPDKNENVPSVWKSWKRVLSEIDPNIKYYHTYAFNIDAEPDQIRDIIRKMRVRKYFQEIPSPQSLYARRSILKSFESEDGLVCVEEMQR